MEYVKCGDYYIPNLELGFTPRPIGRWGRLRRDYLREYRPITYNTELLSGVLWEHLADLDEQASAMLHRIISQMKVKEGVTEELKRKDALAWVGHMNSIRARAEEIVLHDLIYAEEEQS